MTASAHLPGSFAGAADDARRQASPLAPTMTVSFKHDVIVCSIATAALLALYLLLQNPYWVPGGDSEVYTSIARNLVIGKGYTFNGQPVSMVTPGWPWFLAAMMKLSPTFQFLKLVTMSCMLGSLAVSYFICRRFASPLVSAASIFLTGILSHVYELTFWLHSDALFCLVSSLAVLLAMRINESRETRKSDHWRIALLIVLCIASVVARWAGVFTWLIVAGALVAGERRPRVNRLWIALVLSGAVTAGTFLVLRAALTVTGDAAREIAKFGGTGEGNEPTIVSKADDNLAKGYTLFNPDSRGVSGMIGRVGTWGNWYSYLLWQPFRLGRSHAALGIPSLILGWIVLLPLIIYAIGAWKYLSQWIWPALLVYSLALALNWPRANARYLVPIAPLLLVGVFGFFNYLRQRFESHNARRAVGIAAGYFIASIVICNGALYACDVAVARSKDFYENYEAGLNRDLISACKWLNETKEAPPKDGQIALCERYENLGRAGFSRFGLRATSMLTGKAILAVPRKYTRSGDPRNNDNFLAWARSPDVGVKYVLYQTEVSPWRVFHFRMGWLQEMMTGQPAVDTGAGWRLYRIPREGDEALRISVAESSGWPTRVPGL